MRNPLPIGARTVLYGAHQFAIHPVFVIAAWVKLYGWPKHPAYYIAFFIHDWGYLFRWCHDLDGPEGERHPEWAANLMGRVFGYEWHDFVLFHSRFYAKARNCPFSRLCVADKLAMAITPKWLYLSLALATGEIWEYMGTADERRDAGEVTLHAGRMKGSTPTQWWERVTEHCGRWALLHADGRDDTWTPAIYHHPATAESEHE